MRGELVCRLPNTKFSTISPWFNFFLINNQATLYRSTVSILSIPVCHLELKYCSVALYCIVLYCSLLSHWFHSTSLLVYCSFVVVWIWYSCKRRHFTRETRCRRTHSAAELIYAAGWWVAPSSRLLLLTAADRIHLVMLPSHGRSIKRCRPSVGLSTRMSRTYF